MKYKTIKIGIIWANPYNTNMGVAALAYSSLYLINNTLVNKGIDAEIYVVGSSGPSQDTLLFNNKIIKFNNIKSLNYSRPISWIKMFLKPNSYKPWVLNKFDYVFDISEGDSFTDLYGNKRFKRFLNTKKIFNKLKAKQLLLPQTIGPFKDKSFELRAFKEMAKMEYVFSRDKKSYNYTLGFLPSNICKELIDVAFYLPYKKTKFLPSKINVGINVSGLLWHGGYTENNQFNLKADYKRLVYETINFFIEIPNVILHLVPHVLPNNNSVEDDYFVSKIIKEKYNEIVLPQKFSNPIEAKSYISGLDFFIGARMHSCIAAFSSLVPVFPFAYSRKFNGLFGETLSYNYYGDCVNSDNKVILNSMKEAFNTREILRQKIIDSSNNIIKPRLNELASFIEKTIAK